MVFPLVPTSVTLNDLELRRRGSPGTISVKFYLDHGCQQMASVPYGVETLPKISIA